MYCLSVMPVGDVYRMLSMQRIWRGDKKAREWALNNVKVSIEWTVCEVAIAKGMDAN